MTCLISIILVACYQYYNYLNTSPDADIIQHAARNLNNLSPISSNPSIKSDRAGDMQKHLSIPSQLGLGAGSNKKRQGSLYCKLIVEKFREYLDLPASQKQQFAIEKTVIPIKVKGGISQGYNKKKGGWTLGEPKLVCSRVI